MNSSKVDGVLTGPTLISIKELRGFFGLSSYYRRFILHYRVISKTLTALLKKDTPWKWSDAEQTTFDQLKAVVPQAPVLILPNFSDEFCVEIDVCDQGIEAVLQRNERFVVFFNKGLGVKHQTLSIYDKEMLAVLLAIKK